LSSNTRRQSSGYSGRTNKECDSCYSFWVGATLKLLGSFGDTGKGTGRSLPSAVRHSNWDGCHLLLHQLSHDSHSLSLYSTASKPYFALFSTPCPLSLLSDLVSTRTFLLSQCQQSATFGGGFSKTPDCPPDILHTYYSLCWLSLLQKEHEGMPMVEGEEVTEVGILPTCSDNHSIAFGQSNSSSFTAVSEKDRAETCLVSSPLPVTVSVRSSIKSDFNLRAIDPRLSLCSARCSPCFAEWELIERNDC
jgi:prenyltransferase beta subunit